MADAAQDPARAAALSELRQKLVQHRELSARVQSTRRELEEVKKQYDKSEDDLKALQSVGQIIGEVLRQLDEERCARGGGGSEEWEGGRGRGRERGSFESQRARTPRVKTSLPLAFLGARSRLAHGA